MSEEAVLIIDVPASTANVGPGFDSVGLALNLYLSLEVEKAEKWQVEMLSEELEVFPKDETNFVVSTAIKIADKYGKSLSPCLIKMKSDIPLARGLGSSAAAIVAAIELADQVAELDLSKEEKMKLASVMEGHPDNAGAALYGGLIVGTQIGEEVDFLTYTDLAFDIVMVVPKEELLTKASRGVLPSELSYSTAVRASSVSNVLVAALLQGNLTLAGKMMSKDLFHQPYRKAIVPELEQVEDLALQYGAFGVALSGAGPSVICFVEKGLGQEVIGRMEPYLPHVSFYSLQIDKDGSRVQKKVKRLEK
jgi:homoserine kinase